MIMIGREDFRGAALGRQGETRFGSARMNPSRPLTHPVRSANVVGAAERRPSRRFRIDLEASALDGKATSGTGHTLTIVIATSNCQPLLAIIFEADLFVGVPIELMPTNMERFAPIVRGFHMIVDRKGARYSAFVMFRNRQIQAHLSVLLVQSQIFDVVDFCPHELLTIVNIAGKINVDCTNVRVATYIHAIHNKEKAEDGEPWKHDRALRHVSAHLKAGMENERTHLREVEAQRV
jgi:hypothetical protein